MYFWRSQGLCTTLPSFINLPCFVPVKTGTGSRYTVFPRVKNPCTAPFQGCLNLVLTPLKKIKSREGLHGDIFEQNREKIWLVLIFLERLARLTSCKKSDNSRWTKVRKAVKSHTVKSTGSEKVFFRNKEVFFVFVFFLLSIARMPQIVFAVRGRKSPETMF